MKRPSTLCSSAWPRPVPAAISADVAAAQRLALLQHVRLRLAQHRHRVRQRLEIVQQRDARDPERRRDPARVDEPRHVGDLHRLVDHRPGDAEARRLDRAVRARASVASAVQELRDHRLQIGIVERAERADDDRPRPRRYGVEQAEQRLRSSDVAGKNHCLDFASILHHLGAVSSPSHSVGEAVCPHPRLSRPVCPSRDSSSFLPESSVRSDGRTRASSSSVSAA